MKQTLLAFVLCVTATTVSNAQCVGHIPLNAVVVSSTTTINGGFDPIWVCTGDTLISDGGFHNIFLEKGAYMKSGGGIDSIYIKDGATFYMNGGIHVVFVVTPSDFINAGGIPTIDTCASLTFNYTNAPENGCLPTGIDAFAVDGAVSVYPNPASDEIHFKLPALSGKCTSRIYNDCGMLMTESMIAEENFSIDVRSFASGIYCYTLSNEDGATMSGKFIVQ